jgi:HK97 family phage prohead protease
MHEVKTLPLAELKVSGDGTGDFEGRASTFGTIDSYGDTIDKGAYAATIPEFLERGFIGWGHDWKDPIGFVTAAEERADGLWITGKFHGDPAAQAYRTRAKERVEAGKFMGLSIGFEAEEYELRSLPDVSEKVRALTKIKLYEVSLVAVPAERNSHVTVVKSGLPFVGDMDVARDAVLHAVARAEQLVALRESEGRKVGAELSADNWASLVALDASWDELDAWHPRLKDLLARHKAAAEQADAEHTEPADEPAAVVELRRIAAELQHFDAVYSGVAWRSN